MKSKLCCNRERPARVTRRPAWLLAPWVVACVLTCVPAALAGGDAPAWMHALVNAPLPAYDEKTDAVLLYSETNVTVISADKIRTQVRAAYKILRHNGRERGTVPVDFNPERKIKSLHGWCIPAQGKDYEVKDKDAIEVASPAEGGELVDDLNFRLFRFQGPEV